MKDHHRPCDLYTEKDTLWFLWHACQKKNAYLKLIMNKNMVYLEFPVTVNRLTNIFPDNQTQILPIASDSFFIPISIQIIMLILS